MGIDLVAAEKEQNWTGRRRITNLMDTTFVMTPHKWWGDAIIHEIICWSAFVGGWEGISKLRNLLEPSLPPSVWYQFPSAKPDVNDFGQTDFPWWMSICAYAQKMSKTLVNSEMAGFTHNHRKNSAVQQKTNRNRRKRPLTMLFKHKQNTATTTLPEVNCVPVAECFDIDAMCKDAKFTSFFTFNYVDDNKIAVYCRQKVFKMREAKVYGDFFVFAEGVVVFWDVGRRSQAFIGNILSKYQHNPFGDQLRKDEEETMAIDFTSGPSYASNDVVFLNSERHHRQLNAGESGGSSNSELERFAFSHAMAASVKMGIWEQTLDETRRQRCFADLRHTVNSTDLLSKDVYWDLPEIESAYGSLARRLCLQSRRNWVNERLGHCEYFSKTISEALNTEHSHFLEVVIILLIAFECAHVATNWLGLGYRNVRQYLDPGAQSEN
uniref:DUF155 domain-containing protein n=1 Tax=Globodera pallida TaxID=36090 RepID=A0A183BLH2_GLOPA